MKHYNRWGISLLVYEHMWSLWLGKWLLIQLKGPKNRPLFSERNSFKFPTVSIGGWRVYMQIKKT